MKTILLTLLLLWPTLIWGQPSSAPGLEVEENSVSLGEGPVEFVSSDGEYRVTFPPGCGKIVSKVPRWEGTDPAGKSVVMTYISYCDRFGQKGEGCSVTAFFNVTDENGGPAGPAQVVERIERMLETMKLPLLRQQPVGRTLADGTRVQGVDVLAGDQSGAAQGWVRGLLYNETIYLLTAWKNEGELARDPDFITFFQSFEPGAR